MNKDYIILDINDNIIEAIKTDKLMNTIDETKLNLKEAKKINIIKFINYCKNCNVIINNSKDKLSYLLKLLYENKIYDSFKFKYIDIKSIELNKDYNKFALGNINLINNYLVNNLDNFFNKYKKYARVFRGLNYSKYLCDIKTETNKYYGYIVDFSSDKYVSYYSVLKE